MIKFQWPIFRRKKTDHNPRSTRGSSFDFPVGVCIIHGKAQSETINSERGFGNKNRELGHRGVGAKKSL